MFCCDHYHKNDVYAICLTATYAIRGGSSYNLVKLPLKMKKA
jgi:hypothetical protein